MGTVEVGGFHVYKDDWEESQKSARAQASFATNCPAEKIEVTLLAVNPSDDRYPATLGTTGCDKKLVYQRLPGGQVVLNSNNTNQQQNK